MATPLRDQRLWLVTRSTKTPVMPAQAESLPRGDPRVVLDVAPENQREVLGARVQARVAKATVEGDLPYFERYYLHFVTVSGGKVTPTPYQGGSNVFELDLPVVDEIAALRRKAGKGKWAQGLKAPWGWGEMVKVETVKIGKFSVKRSKIQAR